MTSHLWVLIHKHQSEIQALAALGPFATLGAAFIAAGVAGTFGWLQYRIGRDQRHIAASQRDIAKMKVRIELHDRRYAIFLATRALMLQSFSNEYDFISFEEKRQLVGQARFFFPNHVANAVDYIHSECIMAYTLRNSKNLSEETIELGNKSMLRVADFLSAWPEPFQSIMVFQDVE